MSNTKSNRTLRCGRVYLEQDLVRGAKAYAAGLLLGAEPCIPGAGLTAQCASRIVGVQQKKPPYSSIIVPSIPGVI